ncbi:MAG: hypothetical protein M3Y74_04730 [Chloroflexota bacterium]|nr:hypothetical protein [Chloroflexota bacterium]
MTITRWVQLVTLATSCYNVGTIWMVQVSWRLFARVGRAEFPAYHRAWWFGWRGIQPVVFPAAILTVLGSLAQLRWRPSRVPARAVWVSITLQALVYALTGAWWGRWQARLDQALAEDGSPTPLYRRLVTTHWLRVALLTAAALVQCWMATRAPADGPS